TVAEGAPERGESEQPVTKPPAPVAVETGAVGGRNTEDLEPTGDGYPTETEASTGKKNRRKKKPPTSTVAEGAPERGESEQPVTKPPAPVAVETGAVGGRNTEDLEPTGDGYPTETEASTGKKNRRKKKPPTSTVAEGAPERGESEQPVTKPPAPVAVETGAVGGRNTEDLEPTGDGYPTETEASTGKKNRRKKKPPTSLLTSTGALYFEEHFEGVLGRLMIHLFLVFNHCTCYNFPCTHTQLC
ncbi:unnamed protein product, partial [Echinostoma caproni]|uniref:Toxoplasma gondii family A protein n=1 Tax=Echinostoma caproni TaxID=27848 RepID=A0A183BEL0_9TREM